MRRIVRLGLRLSLGSGRAGLARLALMAVGAAVAMFVVLTALALGGLADRQQERTARIAPVFAGPETAVAVGVPLGGEIPDGWHRQELRRVVLAANGATGPVPPGIDRLPAPGEVFVSPALGRLAAREPLVAGRLPRAWPGRSAPRAWSSRASSWPTWGSRRAS